MENRWDLSKLGFRDHLVSAPYEIDGYGDMLVGGHQINARCLLKQMMKTVYQQCAGPKGMCPALERWGSASASIPLELSLHCYLTHH